MISLQQSALEQAALQAREGHYIEAWASAGSDPRARTYVRYHAGDLEGALAEARTGPRDAFLCATGTEIALSLHRGSVAQDLLENWRASAPPEDAPRLDSARAELAQLRATERRGESSIARARWVSACALALALLFLLRCARPRA